MRSHLWLDLANQASQCPRAALSIGLSVEARDEDPAGPGIADSLSRPHVKLPLRSFTAVVSNICESPSTETNHIGFSPAEPEVRFFPRRAFARIVSWLN